jgi:L-threonylcarbamoyladenylate synthase
MPTDTIWGIGCDATDTEAVRRVAQLKSLPPGGGMVVLTDHLGGLKSLYPNLHPRLETLLTVHARPLTVICPGVQGLAPDVYATDGTVALRIAHDPFIQELIKTLGHPLLATAACRAGAPPPATFGHIGSDMLGGVDYVVKYRQDDRNPQQPSPIARLDKHLELEFLRE